jgi:lysophospholipase L1-like esterase
MHIGWLLATIASVALFEYYRPNMSHSPDPSLSVNPWGSSTKIYPQFQLFGDSITQGATHVFQSSLSEWYQRRLDVINRGFSGYTAPAGYQTLVQFFPPLPPSSTNPRVQLMTVFFGANDACLPGTPQHVSIGEYKQNLRNILNYEGLKMHGTKVILVVPGPLDEWQAGSEQRTAANTAKYATACRQVGEELDVPILDLWTIFMQKAGWEGGSWGSLIGSKAVPKSQVLDNLLSDGLHFTPAGYQIVFEELVNLIQTQLPDHVPDKLPQVFPDWKFLLGVWK